MNAFPGRAGAAPAHNADAVGLAGFACVLLAVPLVTCNALRLTPNMTYGDPFLVLGALLLTAAWLVRGHPPGIVPRGLLVGGGLLLAAGLLAIVPADSSVSVIPTLRLVITLVAMPLIIMFAAASPRRFNLLVDAWLLAAVLNSLVGASDLLGVTAIGPRLTDVDYLTTSHRATGLTPHPNHLGLVVAMAVPVGVARLAAGGTRGAFSLVILPILIGGVAVSGSRGAVIAVVGGVIMVFALGAGRVRSRAGLMLVAAVALAIGILAFAPIETERLSEVTVERLSGGGGAADSDAARRGAYDEALDEVSRNPLIGQGFALVRTAHNIYLQLLQAGGVLALVGFLVFAVAMLRLARRVGRPAPGVPPWLTALAAGSGASIGVWLLYGFVGNAVYDRYLYIPVGLVLALALMRWPQGAATPAESAPAEPPKRVPAGGWRDAPALPPAGHLAGRR